MDISSLFANAIWEVSDELTLSLQGFDARQYIQRYTQLSFPGTTRIAELPTFRGELPGNPFWARNAARQQLYGVDLNGDGVPDRGTADVNRDGLNDYIVSGTADNGVPLHEDVRAAPGFAGRNKTMLPHDGVTPYMVALPNRTNTNSRYSLQADFQVPVLEGWEGFAAYTQSKSEVSQLIDSENDFTAIIQGLNCDVVNDRDACLNPFLVTDQSTQTSKNVAEAIGGLGRNATGTDLDTFDLVLNGELGIELPSGAIGAAVGYQWREEFYRDTPTPLSQAGNTWSRSPFPLSVTTGKREVDAFFAELSVPLLPSLVLEAAVRREDFSTGQQSTDPKFGLTWQATDWLTLRATTGDAFIAPTLVDTLSQPVCSLNSFTDLFTRATGFLTGCRTGNPNLNNETSTSQQLGFDLSFGDFDLALTWNKTEFDNRIVSVNAQQIIEADFNAFKAWSGFAGSGVCSRTGGCSQPSVAQVQAWLASGLANPDIIRDPGNLILDRVDYVRTKNAEFVEVTAWDIQANYRLSLGDWGNLRANLQATHIDGFLVQDDVGLPTRDGVGITNRNTGAVPATPEWKANLRLGWTLGNHAVTGTVHYLSAMDYDGRTSGFIDNFANTFRVPTTEIHAWTDFDLAYSYRGLDLFGGEMAFTLGSRNLFDREVQRIPDAIGVLAETQDPMGRSIYARLVYDF